MKQILVAVADVDDDVAVVEVVASSLPVMEQLAAVGVVDVSAEDNNIDCRPPLRLMMAALSLLQLYVRRAEDF